MKFFIIMLIFLASVVLSANNFYYYDYQGNKVYPTNKHKNYLSYDVKYDDKVKDIFKTSNIEIKEWRKYKKIKIIKLSENLDKEIVEQLNKNDIKTYKYFGKNDNWPIILINRGILVLNNAYDIEKLSKEFNFKIISYIKPINLYVIEKFNILPLLNELKEKNIAKMSQPDFLIPHEKRFIPNDPYFDNQWHLSNHGNMYGVNEHANISAIKAWDIEMGNSNTVIAIVDDGMDVNHPDLFGKIIAKHDFLGDDEDVGNTGDDAAIHGTSCAGVASATGNNNEGMIGSCPNCSLVSARMIGNNQSSNYSPTTIDAQAIIWAAGGEVDNTTRINGADVISCSWGFQQPTSLPYSLKVAIDWAVTNGRNGKGSVVIFASGNDSREYGNMELEAYQNVVTVGASTDSDKRAYYSNYGMKLDVLAPSNGGRNGIWTTDYQGTVGYNNGMQGPDRAGNYTKTFGGTSSATPLVSGIAGLILSKNPDLTWREVRDILRASCDKINTNMITYTNGWNKQYGYGRINAYRAVKLADNANFNDIGKNCKENSDCYFSCISENYGWKDGYCTNECNSNYCQEGSTCVSNIPGINTPSCLKRCDNISDCKEHYACSKFSEYDDYSYCIPGCSTKGCRGDFKICNTQTELCEDDVNNLCWDKITSSPKVCGKPFKTCNRDSGNCECINKYFEIESGDCLKDLCLEKEQACGNYSKCDQMTALCICDKGYKKDKTGNCTKIKSESSSCSYGNNNNDNTFLIFLIFLILAFRKKLSTLNF